MTHALEKHTYLPEQERGSGLAEVVSFFAAHERTHGEGVEPRYLLAGAEEGDQVPLPAEVHAILKQVVSALAAGRAVTVARAPSMARPRSRSAVRSTSDVRTRGSIRTAMACRIIRPSTVRRI